MGTAKPGVKENVRIKGGNTNLSITTSVIASRLSPMFFLPRNLEESGKEVIFANVYGI